MSPPTKKPKLDSAKKKAKAKSSVKKETVSESSPSTSCSISPAATVQELRLSIENERKQVCVKCEYKWFK